VAQRLPGPLRLGRHTSGTRLADQGPLCALAARVFRAAPEKAKTALFARLAHAEAEVRFCCVLALGELSAEPALVQPLSDLLFDADATVRHAAMQVLKQFPPSSERQRLGESLRERLRKKDQREQPMAAQAIGGFRDAQAVTQLIEMVEDADEPLAASALSALINITAQNFRQNRRKWKTWYERNSKHSRVEWLLDGLESDDAEVRRGAADDLRLLSSGDFGYDSELPRREREKARKAWSAWWRDKGRAYMLEKSGAS
jgi:HEAT repeat protein